MNEFMNTAFQEALKAYKRNEIPVGAIIVKNNKIISKARNNRQKKYSVLGHAEINAILKAEKKQKDWRLDGYDMYVTLEPCDMCKSVIEASRINKVYYLCSQNNSRKHNPKYTQTNDCIELTSKYTKLLDKFFHRLR